MMTLYIIARYENGKWKRQILGRKSTLHPHSYDFT